MVANPLDCFVTTFLMNHYDSMGAMVVLTHLYEEVASVDGYWEFDLVCYVPSSL